MRIASILTGIGFLFLSSIVCAEWFADSSGIEGSNYFGLIVASPQYKEDDSNADFRGAGLILRGGHEFNDFFAVEGHLGLFSEDTINGDTHQIDYLASIFARGNLFLFDSRARVYALGGLTRFSGDVPGFNGVDETSLGYGLGIELYGHERNALTLEWIRYADDDIRNVDYKVESINLGYLHRF
ncbi:MAG: porin family protein [Candidatus Thiodiazotropha sp. (ex Codakia rugifera)]|nr:porin family protein [Candidatus Thiodiazotropha sp. (ex Codakia rugifera)]